jgi:iron complex transport system permease protein
MKMPFSLLFRKDIILFAVLVVMLLSGAFLTISYGSWEIETNQIMRIVLSKAGFFTHRVDTVESAIVWDGRMPRFIVAFLVGFSLAAAGCIMQAIFKNPMASPGVIGISSGAALGAVFAIYTGLAARRGRCRFDNDAGAGICDCRRERPNLGFNPAAGRHRP